MKRSRQDKQRVRQKTIRAQSNTKARIHAIMVQMALKTAGRSARRIWEIPCIWRLQAAMPVPGVDGGTRTQTTLQKHTPTPIHAIMVQVA